MTRVDIPKFKFKVGEYYINSEGVVQISYVTDDVIEDDILVDAKRLYLKAKDKYNFWYKTGKRTKHHHDHKLDILKKITEEKNPEWFL